jgi:CRISPR locus-related DNA-binding protein
MNIHIATVGNTKEPILSGIRQYAAVDKVYLLHSKGKEGTEKTANEIKTILEAFGIREIILKVIDPFSMHDIVEVITNIARKESENNLFINMTGGTNTMAGAATAASFFVGAQAYYIKHSEKLDKDKLNEGILVELPVPNIPYHTVLEKTQLLILKTVAKRNGKINSKMIANELNISSQIVSYHVIQLKKKKLITGIEDPNDSRKECLSLTNSGNLVYTWIKKD